MTKRCVLVMVAIFAATSGGAGGSELTAVMRGILEPELRSTVGYGFSEFVCDGEPPFGPGDRFRCEAVDEVGDRLRYTVEVDEEGGATVIRADQPASALSEGDLAMLEAPCREFFESLSARRWGRLFDALHPALKEELGGAQEVEQMLEPVLGFYGEIESATPTWLSVRDTGEQELLYELTGRGGTAVARFGFASDDAGTLRLLAFVVTAAPGSVEQARWLAGVARRKLSQTIGAEIEGIDAPLGELMWRGDSVEGDAVLKDGRQIRILVEQRGHRDDFDIDDFHFAVLDVAFLLERALRTKLDGFESVDCDSPVIPDGGETVCVVQLASGDERGFRVLRRGGDHRMLPTDLVP